MRPVDLTATTSIHGKPYVRMQNNTLNAQSRYSVSLIMWNLLIRQLKMKLFFDKCLCQLSLYFDDDTQAQSREHKLNLRRM